MTNTAIQPEVETHAAGNPSTVVLRASGLRKSFGGQTVLNGVDVELRRGEVVLLEGENGSGKTTLLNILTGNLEPDEGTIRYSANSHAYEYHFPLSWFQSFNFVNLFAPDTVARLGFGRTWQDVRLFNSLTLLDNIAIGQDHRGENPIFAILGFSNIRPKVAEGRKATGESDRATTVKTPDGSPIAASKTPDELLAQLGLAGREHSSGDMISLGQSKRVAIARTIVAGAKVLFLDEPLAGLDYNGIEDVLSILRSLISEHEITIVIIEHVFNQTHLQELVTTRWHLSDGRMTVSESKPSIIEARQQMPTLSNWMDQIATVAETTVSESLPRGAELKRFSIKDRQKSNPSLELTNLVVKRGSRTVLGLDNDGEEKGLNLTLTEGEIVVLQAPNGWGKSSLVAALSGLGGDVSGSVSLDGVPILNLTAWERACRGLTTVTSSGQLFDTLTKEEMQRLASRIRSDTSPCETKSGAELSGGQRSLFAFDMALNRKSRILVLDEPFNGMDSSAIKSCIGRLLETCDETILILTPKAF